MGGFHEQEYLWDDPRLAHPPPPYKFDISPDSALALHRLQMPRDDLCVFTSSPPCFLPPSLSLSLVIALSFSPSISTHASRCHMYQHMARRKYASFFTSLSTPTSLTCVVKHGVSRRERREANQGVQDRLMPPIATAATTQPKKHARGSKQVQGDRTKPHLDAPTRDYTPLVSDGQIQRTRHMKRETCDTSREPRDTVANLIVVCLDYGTFLEPTTKPEKNEPRATKTQDTKTRRWLPHLGDSGSSGPSPAPHSQSLSPASAASSASGMNGLSRAKAVATRIMGTT